MIKKILVICLLFFGYIAAVVYNVHAPVALNALRQTDDTIYIFINIDVYNLPALYTRDYKDIFKHLYKTSPEQFHLIKGILNTIMQQINPLYSTAHGSAPHIIGITRRALSWSHLVRAACYEQSIIYAPERYQITLPSNTPDIPETNRYIELNTNILYIDDNACAPCIARYLEDAQVSCRGIIYVDTNEQEVNTCVTDMRKLLPNLPVIGLYVPSDIIQQKSYELSDFNNYLEQLYANVSQDTVEKKLKIINDEINKQQEKVKHLEQMCPK